MWGLLFSPGSFWTTAGGVVETEAEPPVELEFDDEDNSQLLALFADDPF